MTGEPLSEEVEREIQRTLEDVQVRLKIAAPKQYLFQAGWFTKANLLNLAQIADDTQYGFPANGNPDD